jgi:4-hydroxybenzoate polyprenyltransferase
MYLMHHIVVGNLVHSFESENRKADFLINHFDFFLLVFSTLLIAGAGYIINDYFDIRIDRINKPEKVIVGKYIKKRVAMLTHTGMNIVAVGIGLYLSLKYDSWLPLIFHVITTTLLWWYSVQLKRKFLSGNFLIAVLSGMVPLLVGWFQLPFIKEEFLIQSDEALTIFKFTWWMIIGYSIMAAVTTLVREILKDMADIKGDESQNCKTVPIVLGIEKTKYIVNLLLLGSIFTIIGLQYLFFPGTLHSFYIILFVCLPLLVSAVITHYGKERNDFIRASDFIKISMMSAILFTIII